VLSFVRSILRASLAATCVVSPAAVQGQAARVWISTESDLLGRAADLAVTADGSLLVLDPLNAHVLVLKRPGTVDLRFGRQGSGPGEFKNPRLVRALEAGFAVVDGGNNRLQLFDTLGRYVTSRPLPPFAGTYAAALSADGQIAVNTLSDSTLLAVYDSSNNLLSRFVRSAAGMPSGISIRDTRQQIREGKVPEFFRNTVQPRFDPAGGVWLAHLTDGRVERWSARGRLQASHTLDEPELREIRAAFFNQHRDPEFQGLSILSYIADIQATRSGAWVLLGGGDDDSAVLLHISPSGRRTGRWVFQQVRGARQFAIDESRRRLFVAIPSTAEVLEIALPQHSSSTTWGVEPLASRRNDEFSYRVAN
jgi:hypothetical protein